jgi:DNA-3-methyladenine glycosylase
MRTSLGATELHGGVAEPKARFLRFFDREPVAVARRLIGAVLTLDGVGGIIVETEAYSDDDPASHSFRGRTARNAAMFGPPATAYVYRSYGMHWCLNFVCSSEGRGCAVLIRALEPAIGIEAMRTRRGPADLGALCSGPGRLTRALGIDVRHDGLRLDAPPFGLTLPSRSRSNIAVGRRIGITRGVDLPWRFGMPDSPFLSRTFKPIRSRGRSD